MDEKQVEELPDPIPDLALACPCSYSHVPHDGCDGRPQSERLLANLRAAALNLCRVLQSPAMEYLNEHVQNAWSKLFDMVEPRAAVAAFDKP